MPKTYYTDEEFAPNLTYSLVDGEVVTRTTTDAELAAARDACMGRKISDLRSCWICNRAHAHFLEREDWILRCFCGSLFYNGIDITDYSAEN